MKTVSTFNALHLGDNLVHLHFLRKLAAAYPDVSFIHGAPDEHLGQLYPVWVDMENLTVKSIAEIGQGAINAWRGAGGHWYAHPQRNDFVAYHLDWFAHLARLMGLTSPFTCARDLLFDYPALRAPNSEDPGVSEWPDALIINSPPQSGQWGGFHPAGFDALVAFLRYDLDYNVITTAPCGFRTIPCTRDQGMDITAIGRLSQRVKLIIGCVTGPMWPTLNVWNADTVALRVHLLDQERVDYVPERTIHCADLAQVPALLTARGPL